MKNTAYLCKRHCIPPEIIQYDAWLFQARKRYGLSVLNYIATSNHIHLLIRDTGGRAISQSMQLISGRVAQEYNNRKSRTGAFWQSRYFATAVSTDQRIQWSGRKFLQVSKFLLWITRIATYTGITFGHLLH
jgi:REP element-mobilizing transposase RayT